MTTDTELNRVTTMSTKKCRNGTSAEISARANEEAAFKIISEAMQFYKPNEIMLSFNGGKDCTVLMHIITKFYSSKCLTNIRIPVLYIQDEDAFEEMDQFVDQCATVYDIDLIKRSGQIKEALAEVCSELPQIKAVFMGNRRTDPYCDKLLVMEPTSSGWPPLMRINPIIEWTCRNVWDYIFTNKVPYCSLYDRGYTSIGNTKNTIPNPHLKDFNEELCAYTYRPAYELADDDSLERAGRAVVVSANGSNKSELNGEIALQ